MTMRKQLLLLSLFLWAIIACNPTNPEPEPTPVPTPPKPLGTFSNVSLDSKSSSQEISLPRDLSGEGATVKLKSGVSWINALTLNGKTVAFNVEENTNASTGHRFDTIEICAQGIRIGAICVTQARPRKASEKLQWTTSGKTYWGADIPGANGKEKTIAVYNLEKTTGGKDNYKNYPAFAYCIEMNHDPDKNMEWYLPTSEELPDIRKYPAFSDMYYWTATSLQSGGYTSAVVFKYNAAATSRKKNELMGVYAFRNGSLD